MSIRIGHSCETVALRKIFVDTPESYDSIVFCWLSCNKFPVFFFSNNLPKQTASKRELRFCSYIYGTISIMFVQRHACCSAKSHDTQVSMKKMSEFRMILKACVIKSSEFILIFQYRYYFILFIETCI
jgi:hypothetical protein